MIIILVANIMFFFVLRKNKSGTLITWQIQYPGLRGGILANIVTWNVNVVNLSFFKARRGFYFYEKYAWEIFKPTNLCAGSYLLSEMIDRSRNV